VEGHVFKLKKAIYGTKQAAATRLIHQTAADWHPKILVWIEENRYPVVNSKTTISMKKAGDNFIIHVLFVNDIKRALTKKALVLFVNDMKTALTKKALVDEFHEKYSKDFEITRGCLMDRFRPLSGFMHCSPS
jgi:hypothetical protein